MRMGRTNLLYCRYRWMGGQLRRYFEGEIRKQVLVATEEADLILFLVDNQTGITDLDEDVAMILRQANIPVILCANKIENNIDRYNASEFYKLGLGEPNCLSAITGSGTGDLLDTIIERLGTDQTEEEENNIPHFAIVGRPQCRKEQLN